MRPVLTPDEMAAVDSAATEPVEVLIGRAGAALAREALVMLGGAYGRRVVAVAGKGNNGNDGRDAARRLQRRGIRVHVIAAHDAPPVLPACDLVIDAAYGTGFRGEYAAPDPGRAPVLAVDIPSGVAGLTGLAAGRPVAATRTVTFAALKPGLVFHPGRALAGAVTVADIGLDVSGARVGVVEAADVAGWIPARPPDAHKWRAAVMLAAGSSGMTGAAHLAARSAYRAGAGMVRVASPGLECDPALPTEAVGVAVPAAGWDAVVIDELARMGALVLGPGLGLGAPAVTAIHHLVASAPVPLVVDGDGLSALGTQVGDVIAGRGPDAAVVLTPHDGEFARLAGDPPGPDRIAAARGLAAAVGAIVLLKGPTTTVAHPDGRVRLNMAADARLATAGTGDVLSGIIGSLLAQGVDAFDAAAAGAWLHARAAQEGPARGLIASDVVEGLPAALAVVSGSAAGGAA
jgi:ADP-dependent NAD(P)H-hydrate dehydratase / NAD(P)H-hydrate epimerase